MQQVCSSRLTQSGSVFFDPCEAFEFVSDDESDPSDLASGDGGGSAANMSSHLSPRHLPAEESKSHSRNPHTHGQPPHHVFENLNVLSGGSSVKGLSENNIGVEALKQRIEAFDEITASKISTGSIPEVLPVADSHPPPTKTMSVRKQVERKQSAWRKPLMMSCAGACPGVMESITPRTPQVNDRRRVLQNDLTRQPAHLGTRARASFGILRLAKKFVEFRWRGSKANVDKIKTTHDLDNHKSHWKATGDAKCIKQYNGSHQWTSQPPPKPPITRRQTVVTSTSIGRPPMPFPGTNSTGAGQRGFCDTWDCLSQTRVLRQQALGRFNNHNPAPRPHFGEYRRPQSSSFYQTWHGDIGEASTPVQKRNADVMQSLTEINVARERRSQEIEHGLWGGNQNGNKMERLGEVSGGAEISEEDRECADSLHPQIPVTPVLPVFTDSDNEWSTLEEAEQGMEWLGDEPCSRMEVDVCSSIDPIVSDGNAAGPLEKYRADRLMPQDPMLSQKLLFDTLFETCVSIGNASKTSSKSSRIQSATPDPKMPLEDYVDPSDGFETRGISGSWCREEALSDKPEDVCDASALNWLIKKCGKHSKHLKIEVHDECIAVTGQVLGGFDHTQILHFSTKGQEMQRCDGRPGSMKVWIETIPNGFRERNSWSSPQAGAKMDEYELFENGQKLVVTTHVTFKLGRNCRLRSVFRRIRCSDGRPFN